MNAKFVTFGDIGVDGGVTGTWVHVEGKVTVDETYGLGVLVLEFLETTVRVCAVTALKI